MSIDKAKNNTVNAFGACVTGMMLCVASPRNAQTVAATQEEAATPGEGLGDIVVTARRREDLTSSLFFSSGLNESFPAL